MKRVVIEMINEELTGGAMPRLGLNSVTSSPKASIGGRAIWAIRIALVLALADGGWSPLRSRRFPLEERASKLELGFFFA